MIVHREFQQGSAAWLEARSALPTASEFDNLISPTWEIRKGQMPATYLCRKLAEWWLGGPIADLGSFAMEQGNILEDEAKPWFSLEYGQEIESVGFITTDDGKIGASPDGLLGDDSGIEIKCHEAQTHVRYLLEGGVPKDYLAQVHGSMYVTGRPTWTFLSYRRRFPNLVVTVARDEAIQTYLGEALAKFMQRFESGKARLTELNGGPPPPRQKSFVMSEPLPKFTYEDDVPH